MDCNQRIWFKHLVVIAAFITDDKTVMELGAENMQLRRLLPKSIKYFPVNYKKSTDDTIVCDFNAKEFPNLRVDTMLTAGILENMEDPVWFLDEITSHCRKLILSFRGKEKYEYSSLYTQEIINYLRSKGFVLVVKDDSLKDNWTLIGCFEKMTAYNLDKSIECTGCGACVNVCPIGALTLDYDETGFLKPKHSESKCVDCNSCVKICPTINPIVNTNEGKPKTYACWAKDEYRMLSSSGGVFSALASKVIDHGGVVFGATWTNDFICHHIKVDQIENLYLLRHSKYVQSNTENTFSEVKKHLEQGDIVLYSGCPCQIAGLKNFIGNSDCIKYLITIDLICFYVPSNKLFRKYLDENFGIENVKMVTFRDKSERMSSEGYRIDLKNGDILYPKSKDDAYQRAFYNVIFRNEVCENCKYTEFPRIGDITIGDFWGIERFDFSWNDGNGTSLIYANSAKGLALIEELSDSNYVKRLEPVPMEWSRNNGNRIGKDGRLGNSNSKLMLELLENYSFNDSVDKALGKKFDIGLVVVFNRNAGNNLTNFAFFKFLESQGFNTLLIDGPRTILNENDSFDLFLKKWLPKYRYFVRREKAEYRNLNDNCCLFITGSDQLWRKSFVEGTDYYTCLDWVKDSKFKMSYSTSLGVDKYDGGNPEIFKSLLKRFQTVSVREKSGAQFLNDNYKINAKVVVDPVFLCDRKIYEKMAEIGRIRIPATSYVAAYLLDINQDTAESLRFVAENVTSGIYNCILDTEKCFDGVNDFGVNCMNEPSIEEWVASIADCRYFITDSFHGMCFALIFNKPFVVIFNKNSWRGYSRIVDFLSDLGLTNRLLDRFNPDEIKRLLFEELDYKSINIIIAEKVRKSKNGFWIIYIKDCIFQGS